MRVRFSARLRSMIITDDLTYCGNVHYIRKLFIPLELNGLYYRLCYIFSFPYTREKVGKKKLMILTRWLKCKLQSDVLSLTLFVTWVSIWIRNNSIHIIYSDSNDNTCTGLTSFYKAKLSYFVQTGVEKFLKLIRHA